MCFTLKVATMARAELIQSQEPGASSGSPTQVQGAKVLGHPLLLSQATSRKQDGKWSSQETPYGMLAYLSQGPQPLGYSIWL